MTAILEEFDKLKSGEEIVSSSSANNKYKSVWQQIKETNNIDKLDLIIIGKELATTIDSNDNMIQELQSLETIFQQNCTVAEVKNYKNCIIMYYVW